MKLTKADKELIIFSINETCEILGDRYENSRDEDEEDRLYTKMTLLRHLLYKMRGDY